MLQWKELETQPGSRFCAGLPDAGQVSGSDALAAWLREHAADVDSRLTRHGALLLRGFVLPTAQDFEHVALALDPALQNSYAGTSPRVARTRFVHSASELPPYYPIPQHIEMSFTTTPPRKLFFYCAIAPGAGGTGLPEQLARTIAFETGMKNTGLGLVLVFAFFDGLGGLALTSAFWGIWHCISGAALAYWWKRRG